MNKVSTSYLLWLAYLFGLAGLHRLYNKKFFTGFLWLCTWGLFGFGQFCDLFLIPGMVEEHNFKMRRKLGLSAQGVPLESINSTLYQQIESNPVNSAQFSQTHTPSSEELMVKLAQAAQARGGKLSVTQAVVDTGINFEQVETTLKQMLKKGYVGIDNDSATGVVVYHFLEL